jgi:hypothetical protein
MVFRSTVEEQIWVIGIHVHTPRRIPENARSRNNPDHPSIRDTWREINISLTRNLGKSKGSSQFDMSHFIEERSGPLIVQGERGISKVQGSRKGR